MTTNDDRGDGPFRARRRVDYAMVPPPPPRDAAGVAVAGELEGVDDDVFGAIERRPRPDRAERLDERCGGGWRVVRKKTGST